MKRAPIALAILILVAVPALAAQERTPPGSFLRYRATSVSELAAQVVKDTAARVRFAQHFGVSPEEIGTYFTKNLKLVALDKPLKTTVWYVGRSGQIYKKTKLYPKGTLVFAGPDSKPLLIWSCGNPLSANLPLVEETKVLPVAETVTQAAVTAPPVPELIETTPVAAPPPVGPLSMPPVAVPPPATSRFFFPFFWWPSHHHHYIPEPAGILTLAIGLAGPAAMVIRRSRARR